MPQSQPTIFNSPEFGRLEAIHRDGQPWFLAHEVCSILGYKNHSDAVSRHCKLMSRFTTLGPDGQPRAYTVIPEGDLYRLIIRSKLPQAEKFEKWVVEEVLPAIRKTGKYQKQQTHLETAIELVEALTRTEALQAKIIADKPKVDYAEAVQRDGGSWSMKNTADLLGMGRNSLFKLLREMGIMQPEKTTVYREYIDRGYFETVEAVKNGHTYVATQTTGKGRVWLASKLGGQK